MHTRAAPKQERFPDYDGDVVADVVTFLRERCALARARAASPTSSSCSIPGPDFAKTPAADRRGAARLERLRALGRPLLLAVSRKYFLGAITGPPAGRAPGRHARRRRLGASTRAPRSSASTTSPRVRDFLARQARPRRAAPRCPPSTRDDEALKWIRARTSR